MRKASRDMICGTRVSESEIESLETSIPKVEREEMGNRKGKAEMGKEKREHTNTHTHKYGRLAT